MDLSPDLEKCVAASMDLDDTALLPYLPEIFQDWYELGSNPEALANLVLGLFPDAQPFSFLELGCGKGALSHRLAAHPQARGLGIDAVEGFIHEARTRALELGVAGRIRFECGDVREELSGLGSFDVVILGSTGLFFPTLGELLRALRPRLGHQGFLVLDHGYKKEDTPDIEGLTRAETLEIVRAENWQVLQEVAEGLEMSLPVEIQVSRLESSLRRLTAKYSHLAAYFTAYLENQKAAYTSLANDFINTALILRPIELPNPSTVE